MKKKIKDIDLRQMQMLCEGKHSDSFIAAFFDMRLTDWLELKCSPEVQAHLKDGYSVPKAIAEDKLFSLANGTAEQIKTTFEKTGRYDVLVNTSTDEIISAPEYRMKVEITRPVPSITALKFVLGNLAPHEWRDRVEHTDENATAMSKLILEAQGRSEKFKHRRQLEAPATNGAQN